MSGMVSIHNGSHSIRAERDLGNYMVHTPPFIDGGHQGDEDLSRLVW